MAFDVTVVIPRGSRNKYAMDHRRHRIRLDRTLFTATRYPADHGYVEGTRGRGGEPLGALVVLRDPTFPGCVVECRAIGLYVLRDEKGTEEQVLCVPARDPRYAALQDIGDVPEFQRREIAHFFEVYKELEPGGSVKGSHWADRAAASVEIEVSRQRAARAEGR
jgi:inorganic pyrophosphatase